MTALAPRPHGTIAFGGVSLRARSVEFKKSVAIQDWQRAFKFAEAMEDSAAYWIGELLVYAENRKDWRTKLDQAKAHTGLSRGTLMNYATLCRKVAQPERDLAPSIRHAMTVTKLPAPAQAKYLGLAKTEGLSAQEMDRRIKRDGRTQVLNGKAEGVHAVEVIVSLSIEAQDAHAAEQIGRALVKQWAGQARTDGRILSASVGVVRTVEPRAENSQPTLPACVVCASPGTENLKASNAIPAGVVICAACRQAVARREVGITRNAAGQVHVTDGRA